MEQWKPITGFENSYEISTLGRVKNIKTDNHRLMKIAYMENRQPLIQLKRKGRYNSVSVAKLVLETFVPNPYNFERITYLDGDKHNVKLSNLLWGNENEILMMLGFTYNNTQTIGVIKNACNVRGLFDRLLGDETVRQKKTWFYGVDLYGNIQQDKFEHSLSEELIDNIWEKWITYEENKRA